VIIEPIPIKRSLSDEEMDALLDEVFERAVDLEGEGSLMGWLEREMIIRVLLTLKKISDSECDPSSAWVLRAILAVAISRAAETSFPDTSPMAIPILPSDRGMKS